MVSEPKRARNPVKWSEPLLEKSPKALRNPYPKSEPRRMRNPSQMSEPRQKQEKSISQERAMRKDKLIIRASEPSAKINSFVASESVAPIRQWPDKCIRASTYGVSNPGE